VTHANFWVPLFAEVRIYSMTYACIHTDKGHVQHVCVELAQACPNKLHTHLGLQDSIAVSMEEKLLSIWHLESRGSNMECFGWGGEFVVCW